MSLEALWQHYRRAGYAALQTEQPDDALACFYLAILAFGEGDFRRAAEWAAGAARRQPERRVYAQAAIYLERVIHQGKAGVYVDGAAFGAFIRGGGNVELYAAVSAALRDVYVEYESLRLLDIGVGDGLALLPALTDRVHRVDLVEPSLPMLATTRAALDARGVSYRAFNQTLQAFMGSPEAQGGSWDVIQATWSLQSIPPAERPAVFRWLRAHGARLLIAEFDVPRFAALASPDHVRYVVERYEQGLAEYEGDGGLVAQGFLLPVMFGYFDRTAARTNWEGPIQNWVDGLRAAGFAHVERRPLYPYFWAQAVLLDAR
ncbi:MAG: class I SAM-dependent methyltransferase [Anaerolineae bacterium]